MPPPPVHPWPSVWGPHAGASECPLALCTLSYLIRRKSWLGPLSTLQWAESLPGCESSCHYLWMHTSKGTSRLETEACHDPLQEMEPVSSPPRWAGDHPRTAPQSESAHECSPAFSSQLAAWCPVFGGRHTLLGNKVEFQNIILVFFVGSRHLSADALGLQTLPWKNYTAFARTSMGQCTLGLGLVLMMCCTHCPWPSSPHTTISHPSRCGSCDSTYRNLFHPLFHLLPDCLSLVLPWYWFVCVF